MKLVFLVFFSCYLFVAWAHFGTKKTADQDDLSVEDLIDFQYKQTLRMNLDMIKNLVEEGFTVEQRFINTVKEYALKVLGRPSIRAEGLQMIKKFLNDLGSKVPQQLKEFLESLVGGAKSKSMNLHSPSVDDLIDFQYKQALRMNFDVIRNLVEDGFAVAQHYIDMIKEYAPKVLARPSIREEGLTMIKGFLNDLGTKVPQQLREFLEPLVGRTKSKSTNLHNPSVDDLIDFQYKQALKMNLDMIRNLVEDGFTVAQRYIDTVKEYAPKVLARPSIREEGIKMIKDFLTDLGTKVPQQLKEFLEPLVGRH